jgi:nucleotidyltransferase/DNA polymerase involved in DNA repair
MSRKSTESVIACALIPRFTLLAVAEGRRELLLRPMALAPEPGGPQVVGQASGPAEAFGIGAGMRLGEALARCPDLVLVPPDPERAEAAWEDALERLEGIGAAVEPGAPGEAFFEVGGLRGLYGSVERALRRARDAIGPPVRLGAGLTRLVAYAAAQRSRPRRAPVVVPAAMTRSFLAPLPVSLLRERLIRYRAAPASGHGRTIGRPSGSLEAEEAARFFAVDLPDKLERLGIESLGQLAELPDAAIADRFGRLGLVALRMARGSEEPLRPRRPPEGLAEGIELGEAISGPRLERVVALLVDRLLANPARRGRSLRRVRLAVRLAGGGGWRDEATLRQASADRERLLLALAAKLGAIPGAVVSLTLRVLEMGPASGDQATIDEQAAESRRRRLAEAVRQARAAAGKDAVLRVIDADAESRVPERRSLLTPYQEDGS